MGTTNLHTADQEVINSNDDVFRIQIGSSGKMADTQSSSSNTINLNPQIENRVNDDDATAISAQNYINRMQNKLRDVLLQGSITTLGDPNIYDPIDHMTNKYITIMSYDNKGTPMPFYCGNFKVTSWTHTFNSFTWNTTLNISSLYAGSDKVQQRQEDNANAATTQE